MCAAAGGRRATIRSSPAGRHQWLSEALEMPAPIVIVHDDPVFLDHVATALRNAGQEVAAFDDPMAALDALSAAERVELLITKVGFQPSKPHGVSLALVAKS